VKCAQSSCVVRAVIYSVVLLYVYRLSASGRGWVDWLVLGLVILAISWNLFQLGRHFHEAGRPRDVGHLGRVLCLWTVGIMNTLLRPEASDSWKVAVGWVLLVLAALDTAWIWHKEQALPTRPHPPAEELS